MTLTLHRTVAEFRNAAQAVRQAGKRLGLVPTMGALHAGHLALVAEARGRAAEVALTIFVNPTQFGPNEDFTKYPRDEQADLDMLDKLGVDLTFLPSVEEMYPPGVTTSVDCPPSTSMK